MASWTAEEIASIKAAIVKLATGGRVASVSYAGPPARTAQYVPTDLAALKALLADMEANAEDTVAPTFRRASIAKGFYPPRGNGE